MAETKVETPFLVLITLQCFWLFVAFCYKVKFEPIDECQHLSRKIHIGTICKGLKFSGQFGCCWNLQMYFYQSFVIGVSYSGNLQCQIKNTMSCSILSLDTVQPVEGCKEKGKHTLIFPQHTFSISHKIWLMGHLIQRW